MTHSERLTELIEQLTEIDHLLHRQHDYLSMSDMACKNRSLMVIIEDWCKVAEIEIEKAKQ